MNDKNIIDDWQINQEKQLYCKIEVKVSRDMINDLFLMHNIDIEALIKNQLIKNELINEIDSLSNINIIYE